MDRIDDPVDSRIAANSLMLRIDQNNLVVLVGRVLVDPVGVEDSQIGTATTNSLFASRLERSLVFELVYTLVGGFA